MFAPGIPYVNLQCELYGYLSNNDISWRRSGQEIGSIQGVYVITTSRSSKNNSIKSEGGIGQSIVSYLRVIRPFEEHSGIYECYSGDEVLRLSLIPEFEPPTSSNKFITPIFESMDLVSSSPSNNLSIELNFISEIAGTVCAFFLVAMLIIVVIILVLIHKRRKRLEHLNYCILALSLPFLSTS